MYPDLVAVILKPIRILADLFNRAFGRDVVERSSGTFEYWIGRDVNYKRLWDAYEDGYSAYSEKFQTMDVHLLRIEFSQPESETDPLFAHEATYKTLKGYFHDLKQLCLSRDEFMRAGPLFLAKVDRGSAAYEFYVEGKQGLLLGTTLADEKVVGEHLQNYERKLAMVERHFPNTIGSEDYLRFMEAKTPREIDDAMKRLIRHNGVRRITMSERPLSSPDGPGQMVDLSG